MSPARRPQPVLRAATDADLAAIEVWLRAEQQETGDGFYCNWNIITDRHEAQAVFVVDVDGDPVAFLANEGAHHLIAEVRPDQRGRGYGKVIAGAMIAQSTARGLSVIEIACAPETSAPFWSRMGFTPVPGREGYGGGIYAYREIPRPLGMGSGPRIPFVVRFYAEAVRHRGGLPFRTFRGHGELHGDSHLGLPERAVCFAPAVHDLLNSYVEIEVAGNRVFFDKIKRDEALAFGVTQDAERIPYIETIRLRRRLIVHNRD